MQPRGLLPLLAALAVVGAAPPPAAAHGEGPPNLVVEPVTYYAHDFERLDELREFPLDRRPPATETDQSDPCLTCVGEPELALNFTTSQGLDGPVLVHDATMGRFLFWLRAWEPTPGAAVPAPQTRVKFRLLAEPGGLLGAGTTMVNLTSGPVNVSVPFPPLLHELADGAKLRWQVSVAGPAGLYNPAAVPFGVSPEHPFAVTFHRIVPPEGPLLELRATGGIRNTTRPGGTSTFIFEAVNHDIRTHSVSLAVRDLPANASASLLDALDAPVTAGFDLLPAEALRFTLRVEGLAAGTHAFFVEATAAAGPNATLGLLAIVEDPAPARPAHGDGIPGPSWGLAFAAPAGLAWARRRRGAP